MLLEILYIGTLVSIIIVGIVGIVIVLSLYFHFEGKLRILLIPLLNMMFIITNNVFILYQSTSSSEDLAYLYGSLSQVSLSLLLSVVVWFILSFEGEFTYLKVSFAVSFPFATLFVFILELQTGNRLMLDLNQIASLYVAQWIFPVGALMVVQGIVTGYWFYSGLSRIKNYVVDLEQDRQIRRMQLGVLLSFLIAPFLRIMTEISQQVVGLNNDWLVISWVIASAMISIGGFLTILGYFSSRRIEFLRPQKEHLINRYMNFVFNA